MKTTNTVISDDQMISVEYWRERFLKARGRLEGKSIIRTLVLVDVYYDSVDGINDFKNVSRGKAGLEKTRKVVLALEKHLEDAPTTPKKNYLKKIKPSCNK